MCREYMASQLHARPHEQMLSAPDQRCPRRTSWFDPAATGCSTCGQTCPEQVAPRLRPNFFRAPRRSSLKWTPLATFDLAAVVVLAEITAIGRGAVRDPVLSARYLNSVRRRL